jgi:hypothetical protein
MAPKQSDACVRIHIGQPAGLLLACVRHGQGDPLRLLLVDLCRGNGRAQSKESKGHQVSFRAAASLIDPR